MPEFPGHKGLVRKVSYNEAEFGTGKAVFKIQAFGLRNLKFMLAECVASLESAIEKVEEEIEWEESKTTINTHSDPGDES